MKDELTPEARDSLLQEFLSVVGKRRRVVYAVTAAACFVGIAVAYLLTPTYRAETTILPPQMRYFDIHPQMSLTGGQSQEMLRTLTSVNATNYLYIGMLQSRTILDSIIERFDLMNQYGLSSRDETREALSDAFSATSGKYGILSITVESGDPEMAADMANAFVDELKRFTTRIAVAEASRRRLFFEDEIRYVKERLELAEESMREFREKTGAIQIDEQAEAVIESFSKLRAEIAAKEVDLKVLGTYTTPQNPDYQRVEEELKGMKEQLFRLEQKGAIDPDSLLTSGMMPSVETGYARKLRDLQYYETLLELIGRQYEIARVDEARQSVLIQVLDKAIPPEKNIGPNRPLIIGALVSGGFVLSLFVVILVEYWSLIRRL